MILIRPKFVDTNKVNERLKYQSIVRFYSGDIAINVLLSVKCTHGKW